MTKSAIKKYTERLGFYATDCYTQLRPAETSCHVVSGSLR